MDFIKNFSHSLEVCLVSKSPFLCESIGLKLVISYFIFRTLLLVFVMGKSKK
ncbi:MAG: hypothetical protein J0H68_09240 [Sphingobacteriia bacterium]|nr:hypothetical protein [Sphingobacteriia bacterium]